jgi:hypothetical protein
VSEGAFRELEDRTFWRCFREFAVAGLGPEVRRGDLRMQGWLPRTSQKKRVGRRLRKALDFETVIEEEKKDSSRVLKD